MTDTNIWQNKFIYLWIYVQYLLRQMTFLVVFTVKLYLQKVLFIWIYRTLFYGRMKRKNIDYGIVWTRTNTFLKGRVSYKNQPPFFQITLIAEFQWLCNFL